MADLKEVMGEEGYLENLEEIFEIVNFVENELKNTSLAELRKASSYGNWEAKETDFNIADDKNIGLQDISFLHKKEVYLPTFEKWFYIEFEGNNVILKENALSKEIAVMPLERFKQLLKEGELKYREAETSSFSPGDKVITNDGKKGLILKDIGNGRYLVQLDEPIKVGDIEERFLVFANNQLKRFSAKPGDIVKRKGEPVGEYVITELDEATGKAKIKSKTTGEESVVDIEHIEPVTASKIVKGQEFPYRKPKVEYKEELDLELEEEGKAEDKEKVKEKPEKEIEKEEPIEKPNEVLLTETIKAVFLDPEIAVQIVEKLLDLITLRGLEKNFVKALASRNLELDDLTCPYCYEKEGLKIASAFVEVLGVKDFNKVLSSYKKKSSPFLSVDLESLTTEELYDLMKAVDEILKERYEVEKPFVSASLKILSAISFEELKEMTIEELEELKAKIIEEINRRKAAKRVFVLETPKSFDPRKQGHAYVCFLKYEGGKFEREFIPPSLKVWDTKHKTYIAKWEFEASEGDIIEARLSASWRNDYRRYYVVEKGELVEIDSVEAFELAKKKALASKVLKEAGYKKVAQIEPEVERLIEKFKDRRDYFAVLGELPLCDFRDGKAARFDGKTVMGPWAYMCLTHFKQYGVGLGLGRGQILVTPEEVGKYKIRM